MSALVIIPTYNEVENIASIIRRTRAAVPGIDVLVVDDNSPDGTAEVVEGLRAGESAIHLLRRPGKGGLGAAYRAGFAWGAERGFDTMVEMDADGSHDPQSLPALLAGITAGADLVIGSRYVPGGSIPNWRWHRKALSRWANRYAAALLGLDVADLTAGYRAYRTTALGRIDLDSVRATGYGFQVEMTDRVAETGGAIAEVPIAFVDRTLGKSKMSGRIVVEAMALVTWWGLIRRLPGARRR